MSNTEDFYPLAPLQAGMLFHTVSAPESGIYVTQQSYTLHGRLDLDSFTRAWQRVMERHSTLRTFFLWEGVKKPVQVVLRQVELPLTQYDWRTLSSEEQTKKWEEGIAAERERGFVLSEAPLLRLVLARVADDTYQFLWSFHHLLLDGWSVLLVLKEVQAIYNSLTQGRELKLERSRPFKDYIVWLNRQDMTQAEAFWRRSLKGITAPTTLVDDRDTDTAPESDGSFHDHEIQLSEAATIELQRFARQHQLTLTTIIAGAWALLLSHYSGEADVVFGTAVSGRSADLPGIDSMVGLFINTLPVRVHVPHDAELIPWLTELQAQQSEARQYEHTPLAQILKWGELPGGLPLYESGFNFDNFHVDHDSQQPATAEQSHESSLRIVNMRGRDQNNVPLSLHATPGLLFTLRLAYYSGRFSSELIGRMLGSLQTILEAMVSQPQQRVGTVAWLTNAERQQLLVDWNQTRQSYPDNSTIHQLFEAQVDRTPEAIAVIFQDESLTYRELNERSNQLARHLRAFGVGPETLVGLYMERSPEVLVAMLGILKADGAFVPLDSSYPAQRLAFMLEDSRVSVLVTQARLREKTTPHKVHEIRLDADWDLIAQHSVENLTTTVKPCNLAYVIYTSGSTGQPKGVLVQHQGVGNLAQAHSRAMDIKAGSSVLQFAALSFDASIAEIFTALLSGATLCMDTQENMLPGPSLIELLNRHNVTAVTLPPTALAVLPDAELPSLRTIISAGEPCSRGLVERWAAGRQFINAYGPTETTVCATLASLAGHSKPHIGRPMANMEIYILDSKGEPVPVGVSGELCVGGAGLARGYLRRPALTAERFIPHPYSEEGGARLYRTGDLGRYLGDGNIEYLGRADTQVKVRGYRVELGEIEAVLSGQEGVRQCVVVVREDGAAEKQLVAYVVGSGEAKLGVSELRSGLKEQLPEYMIPAAFVELESLPLTANGKIDRGGLPAPDFSRRAGKKGYTAPRTRVEEQLAEIWGQVLRLKEVGIHDNFFELGGDSILSLQIVSRASQAGLALLPRQLFQHKTIAELAAVAGEVQESRAEQGEVEGAVAVTPIQHWFFEQEVKERGHWNQAVLLRVSEAVAGGVLKAALGAVIRHHDALRLRYREAGGEWQQYHEAAAEQVPFMEVDLGGLAGREAQRQALAAAVAAAHRSLDLSAGPLLRVLLLRLGAEQGTRLLLVIHHLVVDGVSWRIILEDLQSAYEQVAAGVAVRLPAKSSSLQQWAEELVRYAASEPARAGAEYWLAERWEQAEWGQLPVDEGGGANGMEQARAVTVALSAAETQKLLQEVPESYHTEINDVLLTALAQVLSEWSGRGQVVVELEGHGREELFGEVEVSRTVGWFTTIYPVLLEVSETGWSRLGEAAVASGAGRELKSIKEQLRRVPEKGIGYGVLRYLSGDEGLRERLKRVGRGAQVSFNYLGQFDQVVSNGPEVSSAQDGGGVGEHLLFGVAEESSGAQVNMANERRQELEINAMVVGGRLQVAWTYSAARYRRQTIETAAEAYLRALRALISHCLQVGVSAYTPSDFGLTHLGQNEFDDALREIEFEVL